MISIIHPSRSRPKQSFATIKKWILRADVKDMEIIVSVDEDDPELENYKSLYMGLPLCIAKNSSTVEAINRAAKLAVGNILIVVSDDTDCPPRWATRILKYTAGKTDFVLKVKDGIQPTMITQPIMDRKYFQRDGWIYHPRFKHCFADKFLTDLAHKRKRVMSKNIMFRHLHYSVTKDKKRDAQYERSDATFNEGRQIYKELKLEYGLN